MFGNNSTNVIFKALLALAPATNNLVGLITYTYIDSRNPGIEIPVRNEHFELDTTSTTVLYRFNKSILNAKYVIHNEDTIAHTITLKTERLNNSLDFSILGVFDLDPDETLQYSEELGFQVFTSAGLLKYSAGPTGPAGPPGPPGGLTNIQISAGTLSDLRSDFSFNNGNGVSFGLDTNGIITASVNTTGGGITNIRVSAGTASTYLSAISFNNSNNVSFGLNGSVITASVFTDYQSTGAYLTTAMLSNAVTLSNINISAGTTSNNLSALSFDNSNGVSFGINGSIITASVETNYQTPGAYLTTAALSQDSSKYAGTNNAMTGGSITVNTSGISINLPVYLTTAQPVRAYLTTAMASNAATISNINLSAGTTSNNLSAITFTNANGVSFGLNGSVISASVATNYQSQGAYLTTAMLSNAGSDFIQATAAFNGTNASGTIGSNGFSISVANPGVYYSAGTLVSQRTNIVFGDANGVSFGLNPTGQITATVQLSHSLGAYAVGNTTQSTSGTMNVNTVSFRGEGVASVGISNGSVVISVPSGGGGLTNINVSGGTTSQNLSNLVFSNANGLSFGLDGSTITASCDGNVTYQGFNPNPNMIQAYVAQGRGTLHVQRMPSAPNFTFDRVVLGLQYSNATNSSNSCTVSLSFGIYSLNVSTLSLIGSNSTSFNISNSGTAGSYSLYSGARLITLGMSSSLSAGDYWIGIHSNTTTSGGAGMTINQIGRSALNSVFAGRIGLANNASYASEMGLGVFSASFATDMPSAISMTQLINGTATVVQRKPFYSFAHTTF